MYVTILQDIRTEDENERDMTDQDNSLQCSDTSDDLCDTPSRIPNKKARLTGPEDVMAQAMSSLQDIRKRNDTAPSQNPEDEDRIFGQYVACELRKITDERNKALLKFNIQSLIFESQYGNSFGGHYGGSAADTSSQNSRVAQGGPCKILHLCKVNKLNCHSLKSVINCLRTRQNKCQYDQKASLLTL